MSAVPDPFHHSHQDLDLVIDGEHRLADPAVRADREELMQLLHQDFEEVGRTGCHWHRDAMIDVLLEDPGEGYDLLDLHVEFLGPGIILATYGVRELGGEHTASRHSSIWVHDQGLWQVRYHQGTPVT
ncbi:MAG: DUF4440 domain-containing protein [Solirubrobacteraceae bacterium]|nr:DUF4440 domain-containing protein [Solirubrobacteraceae bacterium]